MEEDERGLGDGVSSCEGEVEREMVEGRERKEEEGMHPSTLSRHISLLPTLVCVYMYCGTNLRVSVGDGGGGNGVSVEGEGESGESGRLRDGRQFPDRGPPTVKK